MSKAQLDKFISLVANNPSVLQDASRGEEQAEQFIKNVVQYAKQHGYDFNEDEAKGWITDQGKLRAQGELSDAQLEMVAGGKSPQTSKFLGDLTGFLDSHLKGPGPAHPPKPGLGHGPVHGPAHGPIHGPMPSFPKPPTSFSW